MINLQKVTAGQVVNLNKLDPTLEEINIAIGWNAQQFDGKPPIDVDVSVFVLDENDKIYKDVNGQVVMSTNLYNESTAADFIFYNHLKHPSGAIVHSGDSRDGKSDGDDEAIKMVFTKMPNYAKKVVPVITINNDDTYKFGNITNCYVRIDNAKTGAQLIQFDLSDDYSTQTAVMPCEIYLKDGWRFKAKGEGFNSGLGKFVEMFGLSVK